MRRAGRREVKEWIPKKQALLSHVEIGLWSEPRALRLKISECIQLWEMTHPYWVLGCGYPECGKGEALWESKNREVFMLRHWMCHNQ